MGTRARHGAQGRATSLGSFPAWTSGTIEQIGVGPMALVSVCLGMHSWRHCSGLLVQASLRQRRCAVCCSRAGGTSSAIACVLYVTVRQIGYHFNTCAGRCGMQGHAHFTMHAALSFAQRVCDSMCVSLRLYFIAY